MTSLVLRDYQQDAINLLRRSLSTGHRTPVLQVPTGGGKTAIAGEIIRSAVDKGNRVGFIVDRLALVDQASAHLDKVGIDHGVIQSNHWRTNYSKPVQVISIQTMARRRPWEMTLGIIDECHIIFKAHRELISGWNQIPFIGMSATPWSRGLGEIYDDLIIPTTIGSLIERGHLVDADYYGPSQPNMKGVKVVGGDYNQREAGERANTAKLVASITNTWLKLAAGKQTLCFATNVAHSKHIVERFVDVGIAAEHIDAYTDTQDRRDAIARFNAGETTVLSSVGVLTTGFDSPVSECGIMARPTKSLMLHIQMMGRLLRPNPGKERAIILDHAGNVSRLGFATDDTPTHLDDGNVADRKPREEEEEEERLPKPCPACHYLKPAGTHACPACGFASQRQNTVDEDAGSLEKMQRRTNREMTPAEKREFFGGLLWHAQQNGYKTGWASYAYRKKTGVWPNKYKHTPPSPPTEQTLRWIGHLNIKRAKERKSEPHKAIRSR